jgi:DNA gyrase/topoisomerase IV subunit A
MAGAGPLSARELAGRTSCAGRYVREWLNSQVAGGYVTYHAISDTYELTPEQAFVLADEESPAFIPNAWSVPASMWSDEEKAVEAFRTGKGIPLINLINIAPNERVTAIVVMPSSNGAGFVTMLTRRGRIKRAHIAEFASVRPSGLIAITLEAGDELGWVTLTHGGEEIIIVTRHGQALRFAESSVRTMGRTAGGVRAIRLRDDDAVAGMDVARPEGELLVVTARGYAKRTPTAEYAAHGRHTVGPRTWMLPISPTGRGVLSSPAMRTPTPGSGNPTVPPRRSDCPS